MRLLLLINLLLLALTAHAGEWKQAVEGYGLKVYTGSVKSMTDRDGGKAVEFLASWSALVDSIPNPKGVEALSIKAQVTLYCDRRSSGAYTLRGTGYSDIGMQGDVIVKDRYMGYESIEPETVWYELRTKYCSSWLKKIVPDKVQELFN